MKNFKQLMETFGTVKETVEAPRSEAERNFIKKHVVQIDDKTPDRDKENTKKDKTRSSDYKDGEDALVYEDLDALVNEALCEGLTLKVGVMKFDDGSRCTVTRSDIDKLEKVYATTNDKLGMEKTIKKSKEDFKQLVALGE